ncbi:hypothetical protein [Streptomyces antibioticus]|uniref:hypothetical protein n=1 Tax=Streptomyces antibioticus TaxID=1890 RepID=UPI002256412B|nr:hypothetical protein [Streptomyces antibioticus]MCX4741602.1 hypothetical protein [Streptomyces antibioticus]
MGRVGGRFAGVRFSSRLTWNVSFRAGLGRRRAPRPLLSGAAARRVSVALLRTALEAARARPLPPPPGPRPARTRRPRRR